ncbi:MAG: hypothetical protein ACC656_12665, partial [Candidatus Heimdallarchaeota archaeon]
VEFTQNNTIVTRSLSYFQVKGELQYTGGDGIITVNGTWTDANGGTQTGTWISTSTTLSGGVVQLLWDNNETIQRENAIVRPEFTTSSGVNYTWSGANLFEYVDGLATVSNFVAVQDGNDITLTWTVPTATVDYGADLIWGYVIDYQLDSGNWNRLRILAGKDANTTVHSSISTNSTYDYRIATIKDSGITDQGPYVTEQIITNPDLLTLKLKNPATAYDKKFSTWGLRYYVTPTDVPSTQTISVTTNIDGAESSVWITFNQNSTFSQLANQKTFSRSSFTTKCTLIDTGDYLLTAPTSIESSIPSKYVQSTLIAQEGTSFIGLSWDLYSNKSGSSNDNGIAGGSYDLQQSYNYQSYERVGYYDIDENEAFVSVNQFGIYRYRIAVTNQND